MESSICNFCGNQIIEWHRIVDVNGEDGDIILCDECYTNLFDELDGARGDEGHE